MPYEFNNKFPYRTFNEDAIAFNAPVHCLTYQGVSALEELKKAKVYRPDHEKARDENSRLYESYVKEYGYLPI